MCIRDSGRCFQEALQKACQSLEIKRNGLGADGREIRDQEEILDSLERPRWNRLFHIYDAFKLGISFNTIQKLTKIDPWFLRQIEELIELCLLYTSDATDERSSVDLGGRGIIKKKN